ncbi:MAG: hypothetical protein H0W62_09330 [Chitinophagales bacterium]|nr:hypothetical protein [Chitinophagales bacterium]
MISINKICSVTGFILILSSASCALINPAEVIPAYLQVDTVNFNAGPGQGSSSQRITDVWVDANYTSEGVYEIPKTFPLLNNGNTSIIINAGIWDNGISETRAIYPFYYPDTMSVSLNPGKIYSITPQFTYSPGTKFPLIEDFEAGNVFDKISGDTNMIRTNDLLNKLEGNYSGYIFLNKDHSIYEGRTTAGYILPKDKPVYLEMNYKCNQMFQIGLYGSASLGTTFLYKWNINPRSEWNKIYLNMGNDIANLSSDSYQILIRAVYDSSSTESRIYLDNIKLVNF